MLPTEVGPFSRIIDGTNSRRARVARVAVWVRVGRHKTLDGVVHAEDHVKTVFVIGAGPAGMFAAQKIAQGGHEVIILNRDIKPGGLAEYGIYPTKDKMKIGLRKQFAKVLS